MPALTLKLELAIDQEVGTSTGGELCLAVLRRGCAADFVKGGLPDCYSPPHLAKRRAAHISNLMPNAAPDWTQIALYALGGALLLMLLFRLPYIGRVLRFAFSLALLAGALFILIQQAPFQPQLGRVAERLGLDPQEVSGREVRIRMAADGHFWASATVNGVKRRMLIDSGATVTAISQSTAAAAGVDANAGLAPVVLKTANGMAPARTGSVEELRLGNILARDLKVVVSPALDLDVIGMNFLSKLASWRVEGRILVLVPHRPQPERR